MKSNTQHAIVLLFIASLLMLHSAGTCQTYLRYSIQELPVPEGLTYCYPIRINRLGVIVGKATALDAPGVASVVRWQDGKVIRLEFGDPHALNASGQIVGDTFLRSASATPSLDRIGKNLGGLYGINDKSEIVGDLLDEKGTSHAFLYDGSRTQILNTLGGESNSAADINNTMQVVGWSYT